MEENNNSNKEQEKYLNSLTSSVLKPIIFMIIVLIGMYLLSKYV